MMFTSEMVHLTAVVIKDRAPGVASALLDVGAVQFSRLADVAPDLSARLHSASMDDRRTELGDTRRRIEQLLQTAGIDPPRSLAPATGRRASSRGRPESPETTPHAPGPTGVVEVDVAGVNARIDRLAKDVEQHRSRQADIQRQINRITDVRRQLALLGDVGSVTPFGRIAGDRHRLLDIRYGRISGDRLETVDREVSRRSGLVLDAGTQGAAAFVLVVSMKRNAAEVDEVLSANGFRREEPPEAPAGGGIDALQEADERIARLESEQAEQASRIHTIIADRRPELEREWGEIRTVELLLSIRGEASESNHAAVFSGWVPERRRRRVEAAIRRAAEDACHVEWHTAKEMQSAGGTRLTVPVELRNPRFLSPFQMLVTNFGVPAYGSIDPTPLVAIAYLLMFGLMFGDAGHGLVLVILGLVGARTLKKPGMRELSRLLSWCGGASIVTGVLFGSYFGLGLLPPLWFDYHRVVAGHAGGGAVNSLLDILAITVYFGVGVIATGLVLNWVNRVRSRQWRKLVFEKEGILGGVIYGCGVWVAAGFAQSGFRTFPDAGLAVAAIVAAALGLFLKFPLEAAHARAAGEQPLSPAMWIMDWVIELLEVFSGYLANTLSFMRVAGLGIAHVMLMVAFFQIADMVSPGGVSIASIVVLVFGNALVIALEGLSAGIQSLRLNYYEFFSRYFVPTGSEYRPISLDNTPQGG